MMQTTELVVLKSGRFSAALAPATGGSLAFWKMTRNGDDVDLMRPATPEALSSRQADATAMFPLVPYSNRITGGSFIYWGIRRTVPKNHPVVPDPLHGEGWQSVWNTDFSDDNRAVLSFVHNGKTGFPFAYRAQNTVILDDSKLTVQLKLTNKGSIPMPCGLGLHPFFPKDNDTVLKFKSRTLWATKGNTVFERPMKTPAESQFSDGLRISEVTLDDCFGGCDGRIDITYPSRALKINIFAQSDFNHTVVWSPAGEPFFCVEPVTNTTDAFNLAARGVTGTGVKTLAPEETLTETVVFTAVETA